ncbi:MAG: helix-turn-helix domain-containing protein [Alphaproteobacteria bacterium]
MQNLKSIGQNIAKLRKNRNLSQEDLSGMANIDRSYLSEIENGHKNFSMMTLLKIAHALKVPVEDIINTNT